MANSAYPIDIVLPWVDGSDPEWRKERAAFRNDQSEETDASESRYRESGTLKYLLRSIDRYMPWVRTVHFVTWGHLPKWLDPEAPRLHIVNHREFIPAEYLPTFSSHTIELNMHRIPGLADRFIYFNDDMLVLQPLIPEDYFRNGLPADYAVETSLTGRYYNSIAGVSLKNAEVINQNFPKRRVIRHHFSKWFNPVYGKQQLKTLMLLPWPRFADFSYGHTANPYLKKTFTEVWEMEPDILHQTCLHRFRSMNDVNQWVMRDWQLVKGEFAPHRPDQGRNINLTNDLSPVRKAVSEQKYKIICINDVSYVNIDDYDRTVTELENILEGFLPEPCSFERRGQGQ